MSRRDYTVMLTVVAISGLIGGALTSWMVSGTVIAQGGVSPAKVLQAESIQIVDAQGQVRITLSARESILQIDARVYFYDENGKEQELKGEAKANVRLEGLEHLSGAPRIQILDRRGKTVWEAPQKTEAMFVR